MNSAELEIAVTTRRQARLDVESWSERALCSGPEYPTDLFFSNKTTEQARKVCEKCPVKEPCADEGMRLGENGHGMWGGLTHDELMQERRRRARKRAW